MFRTVFKCVCSGSVVEQERACAKPLVVIRSWQSGPVIKQPLTERSSKLSVKHEMCCAGYSLAKNKNQDHSKVPLCCFSSAGLVERVIPEARINFSGEDGGEVTLFAGCGFI